MKILKLLGLVGVGIIIVILVLWWWAAPHEPSDQTLEMSFYRKRPDLERLVAMMEEDSRMTRVASEFLWTQENVSWPRPESEWGISRARWNEYGKLFDRAGIEKGATRRGRSEDVFLIVYSWVSFPRVSALATYTVSYTTTASYTKSQLVMRKKTPAVECIPLRLRTDTDTEE